MSESVIIEILKERSSLVDQHSAKNDGITVITEVRKGVVEILQKAVASANETASIDERIDHLATGNQAVANYLDKYFVTLLGDLKEIKIQLDVLERLQTKLEIPPEEEKKTEETVTDE